MANNSQISHDSYSELPKQNRLKGVLLLLLLAGTAYSVDSRTVNLIDEAGPILDPQRQ